MKANQIFMRAFGRADLAFSSFLLTMTPGMVIGKPGNNILIIWTVAVATSLLKLTEVRRC